MWRKFMDTKLILGLVAAIALGAAVACGGEDPTAVPAAVVAATQVPDVRAPALAPTVAAVIAAPTAAVPAPAPVGVRTHLRVLTTDEPVVLDISQPGQSNAWEHIGDSYYDTLTWRPLGKNELVAQAAKSWKQISDRVWQFTLQEGITYQNGEPFDADSMVYWFEWHSDPAHSGLKGELGQKDKGFDHRKIDNMTFELTCLDTSCPIAPLQLQGLKFQAPKYHASTSEADRANQYVGNGAYQFTSQEEGISVSHESYPDYWKGEAAIKTVDVFWRSEETVRAAMIQTNEVDWAFDIGPENQDKVEKFVVGGSGEVIVIPVNTHHKEPLKNLKFRQALAYSIDSQSLNEALYAGQGILIGVPFPRETFGVRDDIAAPWPYDLEKAKALLLEIDAKGKGWLDMALTIESRPGRFPRDVELIEIVAAEWNSKLGMNWSAKAREAGLWGQAVNSAFDADKSLDANIYPHGNTSGDAQMTFSKANCSLFDLRGQVYCDDALDQMMVKAAALTGAAREEAMHDMLVEWKAGAFFLPLFELPVTYGLHPDLEFTWRSDRFVRWQEQMKWLK